MQVNGAVPAYQWGIKMPVKARGLTGIFIDQYSVSTVALYEAVVNDEVAVPLTVIVRQPAVIEPGHPKIQARD